MLMWVLISPTLLLLGCGEKEGACDKAVATALKNPKIYETLRIDEQEGEGRSLNGYYLYFRYGNDEFNLERGIAFCVYNNNKNTASADIIK